MVFSLQTNYQRSRARPRGISERTRLAEAGHALREATPAATVEALEALVHASLGDVSPTQLDALRETRGAGAADAVLVGAVTNVTIIPTNFGEQAATRYTITVTANIQLRDVQKDTILWSNPAISLREEYDATSSVSNDPTGQVDPSSFFTQESNALERISDEFSRSVVSAILEAF